MILNGELDPETGRLYASVVRTVAQALSTESANARAQKHVPELRMEGDPFEDEP